MADIAEKIKKLSKTYRSIDDPDFVKSGSVVMDALMGGGIPRGCFILWSSDTGIGKSTGSLYISLSYVVQGLKVLYLDYEGGVNKNQLGSIGLLPHLYDEKTNPKGNFYCYRVHTFADAETFLDALLTEVDLIVIDSVTAMLPSKLAEKSVEDVQPGVQARMMAGLLLKYKAASMKNRTTWIMVNQLRTHIRFIGQTTEEEAGGTALRFYADYRILMKCKTKLLRKETTTGGVKEVPFGAVNDVWCVKSRYSRPFIPLSLAVIFGKGISNNYAYKDYLMFKGCIDKNGGWYNINLNGNTAKVNGEGKVVDWIQANKDMVREYIASTGGYKLIMDEKDAIGDADSISAGDLSESDADTEPDDEGVVQDAEVFVNMAEGDMDKENF